MPEEEKTKKNTTFSHPSPYTYYILCKKCHAVNVPADVGFCGSCKRKIAADRPHDNYRPPPTAHIETKRFAYQCGGLPWRYRGKREDKEMCYLEYDGFFISVQRQKNRKFCYFVGRKKSRETVLRENIDELTFARTRAVRHLAKLMNMTFDELVDKIKGNPPKNKTRKEVKK